MFTRSGISLLAFVGICLSAAWGPIQVVSASAHEVIFVAPGGSADAPGTRDMPLGRIQDALDRAKPGTLVKVLPGVYRERVAFRTGGTAERPIILEGTLGTILDGSEDFTPRWEPALDVADGVFRARNFPFKPQTVVANGRIVNLLDESRVTPPKALGEEWLWQNLFRNGINGWEGIRALALYRQSRQELLVRFHPGIDPAELDIKLAPREPVVAIHGVDHVVVRGLTLRDSWYGVEVQNSTGAIIEYCEIGPTDHGVWLGPGSQRSIVRYNDIAHFPYGNVSTRSLSWHNWLAHKNGGYYDRLGIEIRDSIGYHEVHDNYIHDHFGGIEDKVNADLEVSERFNRNLKVHHNLIVNIMDDGLEPNGSEVNSEWHDNVVVNALCGLRVKTVTHGPLYVYRNLFLSNGEDIRIYGGSSPMPPAEVYVYHNTSTSDPALTSNKVFGIGTPHYHIHNNFFYATRWWKNTGDSVAPNWTGDYNVYVQRGTGAQWAGKELVDRLQIDQNSRWVLEDGPGFVDYAQGDLAITAQSPARSAGMDLAKHFGKPMPGGYDSGYFNGKAPDVGALPFGASMPKLPRQGWVKIDLPVGNTSATRLPVRVRLDHAPEGIDTVTVALDGELVSSGSQPPDDLTIDLWALSPGSHRLAVEVSGLNGLYGKTVSEIRVVRNVQLRLPVSGRVSGVVPVALHTSGIPSEFVSEVRVMMTGVTERSTPAQSQILYEGNLVPKDLSLDTEAFSDGVYGLAAELRTIDGQVFCATAGVSVRNWQQLVDTFQPPIESGWLGTYDRSKTIDRSSGWEYATDNAERFFGDPDRLYRVANTTEHLTWRWPGLKRFTVLLYTTGPIATDVLDVAASRDRQDWRPLEFHVRTIAENEQGIRKVEVSGVVPEAGGVEFLRVSLRESAPQSGEIQIGSVTLAAKLEP